MEKDSTPNHQKLVERAFGLLRQEKKILVFPIVSTAIAFSLLVLFLVGLYFFTDIQNPTIYGTLFIVFLYTVISLINVFVNAVLVIWAYARLSGEVLTLRESIKKALKHKKKLFLWGLIWGIVMIALHFIRSEYQKRAGYTTPEAIGFTFLGILWTLGTYFVLPVMLIENKNIKEAAARSALIFSTTWVKNLVGQFKIGFRLLPWIIAAIAAPVLLLSMSFIALHPFHDFMSDIARVFNIDPANTFLIPFSSTIVWAMIVIGIAGTVFLVVQQIFFTIIYYYEEKGEMPKALE